MSAAAMRIETPGDTLFSDVQDEAERNGMVVITNGRELRYSLPHFIPDGWTRFLMRVKPSRPDPKAPRL